MIISIDYRLVCSYFRCIFDDFNFGRLVLLLMSELNNSGVESSSIKGSDTTNQQNKFIELQDWCNKSLEQLDFSCALLAQCLDSDLSDLKRQSAVLNQCLETVYELRSKFEN